MGGGLMQLIAYGARDDYLLGGIDSTPRNPPSLQDTCLTRLSEKEKAYLCSRREAFPYIFNQITQSERYKKDFFVRNLHHLFRNHRISHPYPLAHLVASKNLYFTNSRYILKNYRKYKKEEEKIKKQKQENQRRRRIQQQLNRRDKIRAARAQKYAHAESQEDYILNLDFLH